MWDLVSIIERYTYYLGSKMKQNIKISGLILCIICLSGANVTCLNKTDDIIKL